MNFLEGEKEVERTTANEKKRGIGAKKWEVKDEQHDEDGQWGLFVMQNDV